MIAYQILTELREWLLATGNYGISCWIKKWQNRACQERRAFGLYLAKIKQGRGCFHRGAFQNQCGVGL